MQNCRKIIKVNRIIGREHCIQFICWLPGIYNFVIVCNLWSLTKVYIHIDVSEVTARAELIKVTMYCEKLCVPQTTVVFGGLWFMCDGVCMARIVSPSVCLFFQWSLGHMEIRSIRCFHPNKMNHLLWALVLMRFVDHPFFAFVRCV